MIKMRRVRLSIALLRSVTACWSRLVRISTRLTWRVAQEVSASWAGSAFQASHQKHASGCSAAYPAYPQALCGEVFDQTLGMIALHLDRTLS